MLILLSRFVLLPFAAYVLITSLEIEPLHAAGLLILASSPGGVTSNVFTFFCEGDLSLRYTYFFRSSIFASLLPSSLFFSLLHPSSLCFLLSQCFNDRLSFLIVSNFILSPKHFSIPFSLSFFLFFILILFFHSLSFYFSFSPFLMIILKRVDLSKWMGSERKRLESITERTKRRGGRIEVESSISFRFTLSSSQLLPLSQSCFFHNVQFLIHCLPSLHDISFCSN